MRRPRRNHTAAFKAKVAIAALKGDETLAALAKKFDVHPNQITQWKTQWLENASGVFATSAEKQAATPNLKELHAKVSPAMSRVGSGDWPGPSAWIAPNSRSNTGQSINAAKRTRS